MVVVSTRIWLVRHGETTFNAGSDRFNGWNDDLLTDRGRRQAASASARLATEPLRAVYSSDLARARDTARIIARPHALDVGVINELREVHYGDWVGQTHQEIAAATPDLYEAWKKDAEHVRIPGGETFGEALSRSRPILDSLANRHPDSTVAVVSHKSIIRILICSILGMSISRYQQIGMENCGLSLILSRPGSAWQIESTNDYSPF